MRDARGDGGDAIDGQVDAASKRMTGFKTRNGSPSTCCHSNPIPFTATASIKIDHSIPACGRGQAGNSVSEGVAGVQPRLRRNEKSKTAQKMTSFRTPLFFTAGHPRDACLAAMCP